MKQSDPQMKIRLPVQLKAWIERQAASNRRTMNGEIVYRLEAAMSAEAARAPVSAGGATAAGQASQA